MAKLNVKILKCAVIFVFLAAMILAGCRPKEQPKEAAVPKGEETKPAGMVSIEYEIVQDLDVISLSIFGEPPQFAIWLEDHATGQLKTVFVTYRSGSGDWEGKPDCPAALPKWFEVFKQETGSTTIPTMDNRVADAVTGATPTDERFKTTVEVPAGSKWICWIEMNQSGDFNHKYKEYDEQTKTSDPHFSGQPPLIYRAEITAEPGQAVTPQLYAQSIPYKPQGPFTEPVSEDITSAREVFKGIKIRVVGEKNSL